MGMFPIARTTIVLLALALPAGRAGAEEAALFKPYGFIRLDFIVDDSRLSHPQSPFFVPSEDDGNRSEVSIHPRLTRLGIDLVPQTLDESAEVSGTIEVDFQNGGRESRQLPRLRHGYLTLRAGTFELLAGQSWDLISPLWPTANNDSMMWNAGNLGDRRPQLRASLLPAAGEGTLRLAAAVGMTGAVDEQDLDMNGRLDGLDGLPTVQALAELTMGAIRAGVWGHLAREGLEDETELDSAALGLHARLDLAGTVWLQGEAWYGQNLADVRGGIGQDVTAAGEEIPAAGGWLEVGGKVLPEYTVAAGFTIDDPIDAELDPGARRRNWTAYLVHLVRPWKPVQLGAEYVFWTTRYLGGPPPGTAHRIDLHLTFFF